MYLIVCYFLAFSVTLHIAKSESPKKHIYFQIDEFIKQLMTSSKFDELADIIADKAAHKIRDVETPVTKSTLQIIVKDRKEKYDPPFGETQTNSRDDANERDFQSDEKTFQSEKQKETDDVINDNDSQEKSKNNYAKSSSENVKYHSTEQNDKSTMSEEKIVHERKNLDSHSYRQTKNVDKTDRQILSRNIMASGELELNYRNLKAKLDKHRFGVKGNDRKIHTDYDNRNKEEKKSKNSKAVDSHINKKNILKDKEDEDSKEVDISESSFENKAHESDISHGTNKRKIHKQTSKENKSNDDSDPVQDEKRTKKPKNNYNKNKKPVKRFKTLNQTEENQKTDKELIIAKKFIDKVMDKVSKELKNPFHPSKEDIVVGINRAHSAEEDSHYYAKPQYRAVVGETKSRRDDREDNNKTLNTSAEYAEYLEKTAMKPKSKFINTY